jgi:hypothetical protein
MKIFYITLLIISFALGMFVDTKIGKPKDTPYKTRCGKCIRELKEVYVLNGGLTDMYIQCQRRLIEQRKILKEKSLPIQESDLGPSRVLLGWTGRGSGSSLTSTCVGPMQKNNPQDPTIKRGKSYEEDVVANRRVIDGCKHCNR